MAAAVVAGLLAGFASLIHRNDGSARQALTNRFETRAGLTASFAGNYVSDLAAREQAQATRRLAGIEVAQQDFDEVVQSFGFEAAVLLDSQGRLLQVWPAKPELLGVVLTEKHRHLRDAVAGRIGVSQMVPSAARAAPVTAVAVPFDSAGGRRVLSGAFSPAGTPLGSYLDSVVPIRGGFAYLLDNSGHVLASSHGAAQERERRLGGLDNGVTAVEINGQDITVAVAAVPNVPWRVVTAAPTGELFAPIASSRWAPWALWSALAFFGALAVGLIVGIGRARARAVDAARIDVMTGLPNRRGMQERLKRAAALARRHKLPLTALMIDIDLFKSVNDTHGHDVGDSVISAVGNALAAAVREEDIIGRWGGEEFLALVHADGPGACVVAERLRQATAAAVIPRVGVVTISIGVATLTDSTEQLLIDADGALYLAKANGRNRVEALDVSLAAGQKPAIV